MTGEDAIDRLLAAWDRMSEHYLEGRSVLLGRVVGDLADRFSGSAPTICELGCGPGALVTRLAADLPSARLVGVEIDPVLRRLHQLASPGGPAHLEILDTDLAEPAWVHSIGPPGSVDAVIAVQVLHYFAPPRFAELLVEIRSLLAPDGVFVHLDHVPVGDGSIPGNDDGHLVEPDPWSAWWRTASTVAALSDAVRERGLRPEGTSAEYHPDAPTLRSLLERAGLDLRFEEQRVGGSLLTIAGAQRRSRRQDAVLTRTPDR
jgi:SAM-dependent methyltransferase